MHFGSVYYDSNMDEAARVEYDMACNQSTLGRFRRFFMMNSERATKTS